MKTITKNTAGWLVMAAARTRQALTLAAAAAVMGMATASCSSGDGLAEEPKQQPAENTDAVKTYTMTVTATKGDDAMTRALSYDSGTKVLNATWTEGDVVEVYTVNWELLEQSRVEAWNVHLGTLTAQSDGVSTTLDGTITAPPAVPEAYQEYFTVTPLRLVFPRFPLVYTGQKGTLDDIAANFDYAVVALYNWTDTDGKISTAGDVEFNNGNQSIVRFTLQDKDGNAINAKSLTLHDASDYDFIIYDDDVSISEGDLTISLDDASSEVWVSIYRGISTSSILEMTATTEDGETYTYSKTGVQINRGSFYSITVKMNRVVDLSKTSIYKSNVFTAQNGDVLTGTVPEGKAVDVASGAEVTLCGASVTAPDGWEHGAIRCLGDATIILADGTVNTAQSGSGNRYAAVSVPAGKTLTIRGGSAGTGKLVANAFVSGDDTGSYRAGIGGQEGEGEGGNLIIAGGDITAIGNTYGAGIGAAADAPFSNITISGGTVTATGGYNGAGIGSGPGGSGSCECGDITIEGGTVTATGGEKGAGIGTGGAGGSCGDITISGGNVTAKGGKYAAGIGSGESSCRAITISGGTVTATGGERGAGIGSGVSSCGDITIKGGTVTATGGSNGAGIGSGGAGGSCSIITISGGTVTATGGIYAAGIGSGAQGSCEGIHIERTVKSVIATKGQYANNSIGAGNNGECNWVEIADGANVQQKEYEEE